MRCFVRAGFPRSRGWTPACLKHCARSRGRRDGSQSRGLWSAMARPLDPQASGQRGGRSVSAVADEDVAFNLLHFGLFLNAAKKDAFVLRGPCSRGRSENMPSIYHVRTGPVSPYEERTAPPFRSGAGEAFQTCIYTSLYFICKNART